MNEENIDYLIATVAQYRYLSEENPSWRKQQEQLFRVYVHRAIVGLKEYIKTQIEELQDAQAHQQCKERLAEGKEGSQDFCESYIKMREIRLDARQLFLDVWNTYGRKEQTIPFNDGEVTIRFK